MFDGSILIGPLALPIRYLTAFFSVLIAGGVVWLALRRRPSIRRRVMDAASGAGVAFLVGWKLSPILWNTRAIIQDPMTLLYAPGGVPGALVGGVAALAAVIWTLRRRGRSFMVVGAPTVVIAGIAVVVYGVAGLAVSASQNRTTGARNAGYDVSVRTTEVRVLPGSDTSSGEAPSENDSLDHTTLQDTLREAAGRPVVLNFWATWCGPCRAENAVKRAAFERRNGEALFIGVNLTTRDAGVQTIRSYVREEGIPYPTFLDEEGAYQRAFGIRGTPTTIVLGGDGAVIDRRYGPMTRGWINGALDRAQAAGAAQSESPRPHSISAGNGIFHADGLP